MGDMGIGNPLSRDIEQLRQSLQHDTKVKVAGIDADGILRGKIMLKDKFLSSVSKGFGMSSAIFGWDMHDVLYTSKTSITSADSGYSDFIAIPDLKSFRRIPWENNIPFFLVHFVVNDEPVCADGRSMIRSMRSELQRLGYQARTGVELEFHNFQTPTEDGYQSTSKALDVAAYLEKNAPGSLRPLTAGMFGYSISRPAANKAYFYEIFDQSLQFGCDLEAWHTESGPGVFEAAIKVDDVAAAADKVTLFKYMTKSIAIPHGITPCFMAKPVHGLPGNSGHIHISLESALGKNLFARDEPDLSAAYPDITHLSDIGRYFLAGLLIALPDIMPAFTPTINSFKRLVVNNWAPVHISWGLEDRLSSIRLIAPPVSSPSATRFEIRIPGADLHPHYALTVILGAGLRGIQRKLEIPVPPTSMRNMNDLVLLPNTLQEAVARFKAPSGVAREIFGDDFVEFYAATREHELRVWREAVTDWEFKRYIETV